MTAHFMKRSLQLQKKNLTEIKVDHKGSGSVNITQLKDILINQFRFTTPDEAFLVARYLIEPKDVPEVESNDELSKPLDQINSDFMQLISSSGYKIFNEKDMIDTVFEKLRKNIETLGSSLQTTQVLSEINLQQLLSPCQLTADEFDFLVQYSLKLGNNIKEIDGRGLYDQLTYYIK